MSSEVIIEDRTRIRATDRDKSNLIIMMDTPLCLSIRQDLKPK